MKKPTWIIDHPGRIMELVLTPYAELLVRPLDDDLTIRQRFHELSRAQHPDRDGAAGRPGPRWYALAAAYGAIKTQAARCVWEAMQGSLSGVCAACCGYGVQGSRIGGSKVRLCEACKGVGRAKR